MFGWFKPKPAPEGPVIFDFDIEIERPASQVYALIDWADPRNAKRQLGHQVSEVDGVPGCFTMVMNGLDGHVLEISVTEAEPGRIYAFNSEFRPRVGRLVSAHESYEFEPRGEGSCLLRLVTVVNFDDGLTMKQFKEEVLLMSLASHNALGKFKIHAEEGLEALKEADQKLVV